MAGKGREYQSASSIGQFLFCPLSYKYIYIDKSVEREPQNVYMLWGSAMHEALAHNYRQKIKSKKDLPAQEVIDVFNEVWKKELPKTEVPSMFGRLPNLDLMVLTGENVLEKYMQEVAPTIQPLMVEHEFKIKLKSRPVTIYGFIDLVDSNNIIRDHKTVGKSTMKNWTQDAVDNSIQLTLYSTAFRKMMGKAEAGVAIDVIPRMDKPKFKSVFSTRTDEDIIAVVELAYRIQEIEKLGVWFPNLQNCKGCPFRESCPRRVVSTN